MLRLAEQGLAPGGALLLIISLSFFFIVTLLMDYRKDKGEYMGNNRKPFLVALNASILNTLVVLSGNMAGGALLA